MVAATLVPVNTRARSVSSFLQQVDQKVRLVHLFHEHDLLVDVVGHRRGRRHRHGLGVGLHGRGQAAHLGGHGGRKQQGLARLGHPVGDPAHVVHESHVEHAVGLVQDEEFDVVEDQFALLDQVDQAARRGDDEIDAAAQTGDLRARRHAADDDHGAGADVVAVGADVLVDLQGQFAGGRQDQDQGRVALGRGTRSDVVDDRQRERGRLAGAGLGAGDQVVAGADDGDGISAGWAWARCSRNRQARAEWADSAQGRRSGHGYSFLFSLSGIF